MKVTITKEIERCWHECPYFGTDGGPSGAVVCNHPEADQQGYIISHPACDEGFPPLCPLRYDWRYYKCVKCGTVTQCGGKTREAAPPACNICGGKQFTSITAAEAEPTKEVVFLLSEVMGQHADPEAPEYNECDKARCNWCERAAKVLEMLEILAVPKEPPKCSCGCDCLPCQSCDHK
jgi:hypothetical protein